MYIRFRVEPVLWLQVSVQFNSWSITKTVTKMLFWNISQKSYGNILYYPLSPPITTWKLKYWQTIKWKQTIPITAEFQIGNNHSMIATTSKTLNSLDHWEFKYIHLAKNWNWRIEELKNYKSNISAFFSTETYIQS